MSLDPHALPFAATVHPEARPATRLAWDSREAGPDAAFAALPGEATHGNRFVQGALDAGAPFVITDLDVPRAVRVLDAQAALFAWARAERAKNALVVGITGTAGKTTAKSYAAAALQAAYLPVFNTQPAIACFLTGHGAGQRPLVVEMGIDRLGEMSELVGLVRPDVGIVTSIGAAHLDGLGSVENIVHEKGGILEAAARLVGMQASPYYPGVPTYGFGGATYAGESLRLDETGASFNFCGVPVHLPRASLVQAEAAVLALRLVQMAGLDLGAAAERLAQVQVPGGRYRVHPGAVTVIDDAYNASPLSVQVALDALASHTGRKISVLGRMLELGSGEQALHAQVGGYARWKADLTYGVGTFAAELGEHAFQSVPELLAALLPGLKRGDVVLVKASRGISWTPERRLQEGVGLDSVVAALLARREEL